MEGGGAWSRNARHTLFQGDRGMEGQRMVDKVEQVEGFDTFVWDGIIDIPNTHTAGAVGSRFLVELRDNKRIIGIKCPACNRVCVPPQSICKDCLGYLTGWIEVSTKGIPLTSNIAGHLNSL